MFCLVAFNEEKTSSVLIVDDQAGITRLLAEVLKPEFSRVLTATSGQETLAIIAEERVSLLLLDVNMPGLDGLSVLKLLRNQGFDGPVILMTGFGEQVFSQQEMARLKVSGVLAKPFDLNELHQMIASCLSGAKKNCSNL